MAVMLVGIGFVALLTGAIAERFLAPRVEEVEQIEAEVEAVEEDLLAEFRELSKRMAGLERTLARRLRAHP